MYRPHTTTLDGGKRRWVTLELKSVRFCYQHKLSLQCCQARMPGSQLTHNGRDMRLTDKP